MVCINIIFSFYFNTKFYYIYDDNCDYIPAHLPRLAQCEFVCRRVPPCHPVEQLPLYVSQQTAGADSEHVVVEPVVAQLLLDEYEPCDRVLSRPDSPRRLESYGVSRSLVILPYSPRHHHTHGQCSVHALLTSASLDEVASCHHAD